MPAPPSKPRPSASGWTRLRSRGAGPARPALGRALWPDPADLRRCPRRPLTSTTWRPTARPMRAGTTLAEPTTLEAAIARVVTGDAIILRGGTYRTGGLRLNQGITMQPYADERPVLKGTRVATEWRALRNGVWRTSWKHPLPGQPARLVAAGPRGHADAAAPLQQRHGLRRRRAAASRPAGRASSTSTRTTSTTRRARSTSASIPTNRLVEITAFDSALVRTSAPVPRQDHRTTRGR